MNDIIMADQQFDSVGEALAHYGVKGMKWGVTKADVRGAPSKREIKDARHRVALKNAEYNMKRSSIKRGEGYRSEKKAALKDLKISTLSDPDRMTAMRMTTGEKAATALLAGFFTPTAAAIAVNRTLIGRQLTKAQREQARRDQSS